MDVLVASVSAVMKVVIISIVGVICALRPKSNPLLTSDLLSHIGRLSNLVFLPALVFSVIGANVTAAILASYWPLLLADSVARLIYYTITTIAQWLIPVDKSTKRAMKLAILFNNSGSIPLLIMQSLCEQPLVNADFGGDEDECFARATSMIFVYLISWHLWFFVWGFYKLAECSELDRDPASTVTLQPTPGNSTIQRESIRGDFPEITNGSNHSSAKVTEASEVPTSPGWERGSLSNGHNEDLSSPNRSAMVPAGSIGPGRLGKQTSWVSFRKHLRTQDSWVRLKKKPWFIQMLKAVTSPPNVALVAGVIVALIEPVQYGLFFATRSVLRPLGAAVTAIGLVCIPLSTVAMAASLVPPPGLAHQPHDHNIGTIAVFLLCPLVIAPAVGFGLIYIIDTFAHSILGDSQLMRLLLLLQLGMPAAQTVLVTLAHVRLPVMCSRISRLYVFQYLASICTITGLAAAAMRYLY